MHFPHKILCSGEMILLAVLLCKLQCRLDHFIRKKQNLVKLRLQNEECGMDHMHKISLLLLFVNKVT